MNLSDLEPCRSLTALPKPNPHCTELIIEESSVRGVFHAQPMTVPSLNLALSLPSTMA